MKVPHYITSRVSRLARNLMVGQAGFTLIEMLVVVLIMGALAAVVIPNVARFAGRGEKEAKNTELTDVQAGVDALISENKIPMNICGMPGVVTGCAALVTTPMVDFAGTVTAGVSDIAAYFTHPAETPAGSGPAVVNTLALYPDYVRQRCASGTPLLVSGACDPAHMAPGAAGYCIDVKGTVTQKIATKATSGASAGYGEFTSAAGNLC